MYNKIISKWCKVDLDLIAEVGLRSQYELIQDIGVESTVMK